MGVLHVGGREMLESQSTREDSKSMLLVAN